MEANHPTLCLNMIVKNEAPIIARCLASVRPIMDYWVIVDTGSTDGTQEAIRTLLADLPGELHERPWRDFARNRNEALELAQPHGEYVLIMDADDVLEFESNFKMPTLQADSYLLRSDVANTSHHRPQIVRAALPWRWQGIVHEFLTCNDANTSGLIEGLRLRVNYDGACRRDHQTYRRDVQILYNALQTESDQFMQARYQFYLAQSYRDCGEREKALQAYLKRAELGFAVEEIYLSLYYAAQLQEASGQPFEEVMATYLRAADTTPDRAEALHGASRYCRLQGRHKEGYEIAKRVSLSGKAPDGLFVEPWIYEYALLDEFAVNAYWAGAYQDCLDACERILRERTCPEAERARIEANAAFARQRQRVAITAEIASKMAEIRELSGKLWSLERDWGAELITHLYGPDLHTTETMWQWCRCFPDRLSLMHSLPKGGVVVEVGTQRGNWARMILDHAQPEKLYTIDSYYGFFEFDKFRKEIASGQLETIEASSWVALERFPDRYFDWIYIDAGHRYEDVKRDSLVAIRKVKPEGFIVFNDFTTFSPLEFMPYGIARAAIELAVEHGLTFTHFAYEYHGYHDVALRRQEFVSTHWGLDIEDPRPLEAKRT